MRRGGGGGGRLADAAASFVLSGVAV